MDRTCEIVGPTSKNRNRTAVVSPTVRSPQRAMMQATARACPLRTRAKGDRSRVPTVTAPSTRASFSDHFVTARSSRRSCVKSIARVVSGGGFTTHSPFEKLHGICNNNKKRFFVLQPTEHALDDSDNRYSVSFRSCKFEIWESRKVQGADEPGSRKRSQISEFSQKTNPPHPNRSVCQ